MKNILKFYVPFIFSQIAICSTWLFLIFGLMSYLDPEMFQSSFVSVLVIFFIFPCFVYFRKKIYIPGGLSWILLTPVKKTHIIYANFLLNLLKFFLIMAVAILAYGTFVSELSLGEYFKSLYTAEGERPAYLSSLGLLGIEAFLIFLWVLLAGIYNVIFVPVAKDYKQSKNLLKDWRFIGYSLLVLAVVLVIRYFWDNLSPFVPSYLVMNMCLSIALLAWFYITTTSVKIQIKNRTFFSFAICIPLLLISVFFMNLTSTINSPEVTAEEKFKEVFDLGAYTFIYEDQIQKILTGPTKSLAMLREVHFTEYFKNKTDSPFFKSLLSSYHKECTQEKNVACRLEGYLTKLTAEMSPIELARMACPLDPQSCYILLIHEKATPTDIAESSKQLANVCRNLPPKDDKIKKSKRNDPVCCGCLEVFQNKRTQSERTEFLVNSRKSSKHQYRR